jgi:2-methylcitrate dehydratase
VQVHFTDRSSSAKIEVEYPAGHRRRRAEAMPMLRRKFEAALERRFAPERCADLLELCDDGARLEAMPVNAFVDLLKP